MKPVPVPDRFKSLRPWAQTQPFGPPRGFREDQVGAVEVLMDHSAPLTPDASAIRTCIRLYLELDDEEIELIKANNGIVELSLWGDHLHPFQLEVYDKVVAGVCRKCRCTDAQACPDGCSWVESDLCSACAEGAA